MSEVLAATVLSKPSRMDWHFYRSSDNFFISSGATYLRFEVVNHPNASSITFNVRKDVPWRESWIPFVFNDEVIYTNVRDGTRKTATKACAMYIANPRGANGKDFVVKVYES